jgi:hypothetical protein
MHFWWEWYASFKHTWRDMDKEADEQG